MVPRPQRRRVDFAAATWLLQNRNSALAADILARGPHCVTDDFRTVVRKGVVLKVSCVCETFFVFEVLYRRCILLRRCRYEVKTIGRIIFLQCSNVIDDFL